MTSIVQPQDGRGFFMLPQAPEDAGYYVYGTPGAGAAQFAHTKLLSLILFVEREWQALDSRKFGVGNISIANGLPFGHRSHIKGLEVDVRPLRKDGKQAPVTYTDSEYDRAATSQLIALFRAHAVGTFVIFFNDLKIPGVAPLQKHDDHFHFQFN
jgi:penicillin-insensitive murein DD-endopeptidase